MCEYDFDIHYLARKENKVADALSQRPMCNLFPIVRNYLIDQVQSEVHNDPFYSSIISFVNSHVGDMFEGKFHLYKGNLYYDDRLCVSANSFLKQQILWESHNTPFAGHPGFNKTYAQVKNSFFWPNMRVDILLYVHECLQCQQVKVEQK